MEEYQINLTEEEVWAIVPAIFEYTKNPISEQSGKTALDVYNRLKEEIIRRSGKRLLNSHQ